MNAERVHAMLAACLAEPARFERWCSDPAVMDEVLVQSGIDPAEFDLAAIRRFAGFVTKVRHNPLRHSLPSTFRALAATGLEIAVFSDYTARFAELQDAGPVSPEAKTAEFVRFLRGRLDDGDPNHALVLDILRHELAVDPPRDSPPGRRPASPPHGAAPDAIPSVRGLLRIERMTCDPQLALELLAEPEPDLHNLPRGPRIFGYWFREEAGGVEIIELNALSAYVLSLIDGRLTVRDIAHRLAEVADQEVTPSDLLAGLAAPSEIGLVTFSSAANEV